MFRREFCKFSEEGYDERMYSLHIVDENNNLINHFTICSVDKYHPMNREMIIQIKDLLNELLNSNERLEQEKKIIQGLYLLKRRLDGNLIEENNELKQKNERLNILKNAKMKEIHARVDTIQRIINEYKFNSNDTVEEIIYKLQNECVEDYSDYKELIDDNTKLCKENKKLRELNQLLESTINDLEKENLQLNGDLDYYKAKCGSLEEGLFELDKGISKLKSQIVHIIENALKELFDEKYRIIEDIMELE